MLFVQMAEGNYGLSSGCGRLGWDWGQKWVKHMPQTPWVICSWPSSDFSSGTVDSPVDTHTQLRPCQGRTICPSEVALRWPGQELVNECPVSRPLTEISSDLLYHSQRGRYHQHRPKNTHAHVGSFPPSCSLGSCPNKPPAPTFSISGLANGRHHLPGGSGS